MLALLTVKAVALCVLASADATAEKPPLAVAPFDAATARHHQEAWAAHLNVPLEITNSIGMRFVLIPPGETVLASSPPASPSEPNSVVRKVIVEKPFYMARCELTNAQFLAVMPRPTAFASTDRPANRPIDNVSWELAKQFSDRLSSLGKEAEAGHLYRLPTEAEWEHACRAGTLTRYNTGNLLSPNLAVFERSSTDDVDAFPPNAFGLYAMHGNVREWCEEGINRGGSYKSSPRECQSESRSTFVGPTAHYSYGQNGIRLVCELGPPRTTSPAELPFFNGYDLTGWKSVVSVTEPADKYHSSPYTMRENRELEAGAGGTTPDWTVANGVITLRPSWSHDELYHDELYHATPQNDFLLTFEVRASEVSAYWLKIRGKLVHEGALYVEGTSIGLSPGSWGQLTTVGDGTAGSSKEIRPTAEIVSLLKQTWKRGGYNSFALCCVGQRCALVINGVPVLDTVLNEIPASGHVAFSVLKGGGVLYGLPLPSEVFEIRELHLKPIEDSASGFAALRQLISPDVKQVLDASQAEAIRPKFDLTGVWVTALRGNQGADTLYDVRQEGGQVTATFGQLGETLKNRFEGVMQDDTVTGKIMMPGVQGAFNWRLNNNTDGEMSWKDITGGRSDGFDMQRVGLGDENGDTWDFSGTWLSEEFGVQYQVTRSAGGVVRAVTVRQGQERMVRMEGIVRGNKYFARCFTQSRFNGRSEWEKKDANTAVVRWVMYPQYPPNPRYGQWEAEYTVKKVLR